MTTNNNCLLKNIPTGAHQHSIQPPTTPINDSGNTTRVVPTHTTINLMTILSIFSPLRKRRHHYFHHPDVPNTSWIPVNNKPLMWHARGATLSWWEWLERENRWSPYMRWPTILLGPSLDDHIHPRMLAPIAYWIAKKCQDLPFKRPCGENSLSCRWTRVYFTQVYCQCMVQALLVLLRRRCDCVPGMLQRAGEARDRCTTLQFVLVLRIRTEVLQICAVSWPCHSSVETTQNDYYMD